MPGFFASGRLLKRSAIMLCALLLLFSLLILRILGIQIFRFERYQQKVLDQLTTESPVQAARGAILDANGRVLAGNKTVYRVSVFPHVISDKEKPSELVEQIANGLSVLIEGVSAQSVQKHLSHTGELERTVARAVDVQTATAVLRFIKDKKLSDCVAVEAVSGRYYPFETLASHVLGFTGSDGQGLYGLELQYDSYLKGKNGSYTTARDSMGNELPNAYEAYIPAVDGATLHTTIDAYIQSALEEQIENAMIESGAANRACGVVMNVKTGAILAMATGPSFDLNDPFALNESAARELAAMGFAEGSEEYRAAKNQLLLESWSNKAATEIYIPGSTFKILTCAMALEEGVVSPEEGFFCGGSLQVADRCIHCHKVKGHGSLTFTEGLQNSCNPVMMSVASRVGCDTFYSYVRSFGLLEKTGIDLPGEGGSIFHAASDFTELDLATASFGQNFKISVLQLLCAVGAVANGGDLLTPYLVESIVDAEGNTLYTHESNVRRQVISKETAGKICEILAGGVAGEGGAKNAYVAGYRVAAKTGTSEKIGDDRDARISSCVAFAPADDPEIAVIIVVDEPTEGSKYGSVVAAPYVANFLKGALPYLDIEAIYTEDEEKSLELHVPDCTGWSVDEAALYLTEAGFAFEIVGTGDQVVSQSPQAGAYIQREGAHVLLMMGEAQAALLTVPDLVGMTAAAANRALLDAGFNVAISGGRDYLKSNKNVVSQHPAAGAQVLRGTVIELRFPYDEMKE